MDKKLCTPFREEEARQLRAGDRVMINGIIYTGRDAAHKRMVSMLEHGEELPFDLQDQIIYYVGPCPAKPGQAIGSAGPTTSGRMDAYSPALMRLGLRGMIGKGGRSDAVIECMKETCSVYFAAIGGAGALLAKAIQEAEVIAFPDLGAEAVYRLHVKDFPVTVVIDTEGNNLYDLGKQQYKKTEEE